MSNETVLDGWNWKATPALTEKEFSVNEDRTREIYGDYFEAGLRYRGKVKLLRQVIHPETQKKRIELEAVCLGGVGKAADYVGKTLKAAFFFPLESELEDLDPETSEFKRLAFQPRLFNAFVVACGHKEQQDDDETPLSRMVGDEFEFVPRDRTVKGKEKMNKAGEVVKYADVVTSMIQAVYRPGGTVSADNEPLPTTAAKAVKADFGAF